MAEDDVRGQGLPFKIRVMDGPLSVAFLQAGLPAGVVHMIGREGPFRALQLGGGKMRVVTKFYPGNPEATQQVLGATLGTTTITGEWNDRFIGDGRARDLISLFEAIQGSGSSLEVSWGAGVAADGLGTTGSDLVRVGIMTDFTPTHDRPQDVAWSITFEWRSRGQAFAPAVTATPEVNPREGFRGMLADLALVKAVYQAYLAVLDFEIPFGLEDQVADALTDIDSASDAIQRVTAAVTTTANFPAWSAEALFAGVAAVGNSLSRLEHVSLLLSPSDFLPATDDPVDFLISQDRTFDVLGVNDAARESARRAADGVDAAHFPQVIAEVLAPAGTDLRDLALRFYGDPDAWWAIASFNGLGTSEVPAPPRGPTSTPGVRLRIPRLQTGPGSDLRQNC